MLIGNSEFPGLPSGTRCAAFFELKFVAVYVWYDSALSGQQYQFVYVLVIIWPQHPVDALFHFHIMGSKMSVFSKHALQLKISKTHTFAQSRSTISQSPGPLPRLTFAISNNQDSRNLHSCVWWLVHSWSQASEFVTEQLSYHSTRLQHANRVNCLSSWTNPRPCWSWPWHKWQVLPLHKHRLAGPTP